MWTKAKVTGIERSEIQGVLIAKLESEEGLNISLEYPSSLYTVNVGEELNVFLGKNEPRNVPDDALLMCGHIFKIIREEKLCTLYISVGGYQVRFNIPSSLESWFHDLNYMDLVYIALSRSS